MRVWRFLSSIVAFVFAPWTELGNRAFLDGQVRGVLNDLSGQLKSLRTQMEQTREDLYPRLDKVVFVDGDTVATLNKRVEAVELTLQTTQTVLRATALPDPTVGRVKSKRVARRR